MTLDIGALYTTYAPQLRSWFWKRLPRGDDDLAEELTATVFEKAIRAADRYQDLQQPSSWLYRIATTTWIDHLEKKRPIVGLPDLDTMRVTMDAGGDAHLAQLVIRDALPHLAPHYRALLEARFLRGETREEIATREGTTEQAISHRQTRAFRALRGILDGSTPTTPWRCAECGTSEQCHGRELCSRCYQRGYWRQTHRTISEVAS